MSSLSDSDHGEIGVKLAVDFNEAILTRYEEKEVSTRAIRIACGAILESYLSALPMYERIVAFDEFTEFLRERLLLSRG